MNRNPDLDAWVAYAEKACRESKRLNPKDPEHTTIWQEFMEAVHLKLWEMEMHDAR